MQFLLYKLTWKHCSGKGHRKFDTKSTFIRRSKVQLIKNILTYALLCPSRFNSSWQLCSTEPFPEKTPGLSWRQSNGWRKKLHAQAKQNRSSLTLARCVFSHVQDSGVHGVEQLLGMTKDFLGNAILNTTVFPLPSCRFICSAWCSMMKISLWPIWVRCPGSAPSQLLVFLLTGRTGSPSLREELRSNN